MAVVWSGGSGSHNVCVGQGAMQYLTNGNYNTGVGKAVLDDLNTGSDNSAFGNNAGNTLTSGSNNLLLGHDAFPSSATVSNEVTIGDTNITKFRIPGINVTLKDNGGTPTQGHVLTVDGSGEAGFAAVSSVEPDFYGFKMKADGVTLQLVYTNSGADNISSSETTDFEESFVGPSGVSFSINTSGNLIMTV
jgi:hypothetical protein